MESARCLLVDSPKWLGALHGMSVLMSHEVSPGLLQEEVAHRQGAAVS